MTVIVKNPNQHQDKLTCRCFNAVYVDGVKVGENNYSTAEGSVRITLSAAYLRTLAAGRHTIKVELTYDSVEHEFTVAQSGSDSPATGESDLPGILSTALMLLAAYGVIYAISRRRMIVGSIPNTVRK